ncbi:MAG TPA: L-seryl-tRNA(Sec) selenium transferase [Dissulfurispiraceae bacterium]|nr:L-seryl-tRNA(Sec) selenium transferase [Dissulfurispiraceae bacterium]
MDKQKILASLPAVDEVLKSVKGLAWQRSFPRRYVLQAIREVIEEKRRLILDGGATDIDTGHFEAEIESRAARLSAFSLRRVINATGVVIHTNLGRSLLSRDVLDHVCEIASSYSNLEYDLGRGRRGKRYSHIQRLIRDITGAEDGLIVNNNAAAVLVCLNTLARGREVVVSRGELVEIGGAFRIPDVMSASGAILREVGTTNRTHLFDYERAIGEQTALLLKVHQSNFRIIGFTEEVSIAEMVTLGKKSSLPVMFDLGSGCLTDFRPVGITIETTVQEVVRAGADLVTFSGDKLLGGPQGGVIAGKSEIIERIARNPLMRAVRIDKLTLAAFEATLMKYLDDETARNSIPTLRMIFQDPAVIRKRAQRIARLLRSGLAGAAGEGVTVAVVAETSQSGGGALPEIEFRTFAVSVRSAHLSAHAIEERLRRGTPPVIARIREEALIIDARTVQDNEIGLLTDALVAALTPRSA